MTRGERHRRVVSTPHPRINDDGRDSEHIHVMEAGVRQKSGPYVSAADAVEPDSESGLPPSLLASHGDTHPSLENSLEENTFNGTPSIKARRTPRAGGVKGGAAAGGHP
jgi:hypothetical protein